MSPTPVAACEEVAGVRVENGDGESLPGGCPAFDAVPTPLQPAFPLRPALLPLRLETWPWAAKLWVGSAQSRERLSGRALQVCAVCHCGASQTGEAGSLRTKALASIPGGCPGVAGPAAAAAGPRSELISRGGSRSAALTFAALTEPGLGVRSFSGACTPLFLEIGTEVRKFKTRIIFLKKQSTIRPFQPG